MPLRGAAAGRDTSLLLVVNIYADALRPGTRARAIYFPPGPRGRAGIARVHARALYS